MEMKMVKLFWAGEWQEEAGRVMEHVSLGSEHSFTPLWWMIREWSA